MVNEESETPSQLLRDWFRRVRESQHVHYSCANYFGRLHLLLGVPTVIFTILVGTAVFTSLEKQDIGSFKILVGLVSILAAILSGLQTFLRFSERAEKHRATAAGYSAVRRHLEFLATFPPSSVEGWKQALAEVRKQMDDLTKSSPEVPASIFNYTVRQLKEKGHNRIFNLPSEAKY